MSSKRRTSSSSRAKPTPAAPESTASTPGGAGPDAASDGSPPNRWPRGVAVGLLLVSGVIAAAIWMEKPRPSRAPSNPAPSEIATPGATPTKNAAAESSTNSAASLAAWVNRGSELLAANQFEEAAALLTEARNKNPEDEDVRYNLAIALAKLGKNKEAIQEYEEALRIFPDYVEAHNNLGNLLLRLGRLDEAATHFEDAVKVTPDYASAWNNLGSVRQRQGRMDDALESFQKAVSFKTNYWEAHHNLGNCFLRRGRLAEAQAAFETVLRFKPDFEPARRALAGIETPPLLRPPTAPAANPP